MQVCLVFQGETKDGDLPKLPKEGQGRKMSDTDWSGKAEIKIIKGKILDIIKESEVHNYFTTYPRGIGVYKSCECPMELAKP